MPGQNGRKLLKLVKHLQSFTTKIQVLIYYSVNCVARAYRRNPQSPKIYLLGCFVCKIPARR